MTVVWDKISKLAADITEKFNATGEQINTPSEHQY